jgi:uncharacterized protein
MSASSSVSNLNSDQNPTNLEVTKIYCSYREIDSLCRETAVLTSHSFDPDVILAIGGGGLIPARIIRNVIKKPIYVVSFSSYDENDNQLDELREIQWMDFSNLRDKKILIVDEIDDTRKTLAYVVNKLVTEESITSTNIGVFVVHNKAKNKCIQLKEMNIGYYQAARSIPDNWIVYPWD